MDLRGGHCLRFLALLREFLEIRGFLIWPIYYSFPDHTVLGGIGIRKVEPGPATSR